MSDSMNGSFVSQTSSQGKVKLILRVKKKENENHKQIISLINKLSAGEKVSLSETKIQVIEPGKEGEKEESK
jgi:hypothetical protein